MKFPPLPFVALAGALLLILAGAGRAGDEVAKHAPDVQLELLRKKVDETCAIPANRTNGVCDGMFATMLQYQKLMNREAREDQKIAPEAGRSASESGQQKPWQGNERIVVGRQAATVKSVPEPCGSASIPCPKPCATPPCR